MSQRGPTISDPRRRSLRRMIAILMLAATVGTGFASADPDPFTIRGACIARGQLYVENGQTRFSAKGFCGPIPITIVQTLGPFEYQYPAWTGGCGYGPGPWPRLRLGILAAGAVPGARETFWYFPDLVVGNNRLTAPYSTNRILIRDVELDAYGRPTAAGAIVGHGMLLTRLTGSCDVSLGPNSQATVVFVLHDNPGDFEL